MWSKNIDQRKRPTKTSQKVLEFREIEVSGFSEIPGEFLHSVKDAIADCYEPHKFPNRASVLSVLALVEWAIALL